MTRKEKKRDREKHEERTTAAECPEVTCRAKPLDLVLIEERPLVDLLPDLDKPLEASGVRRVDKQLYVVVDNDRRIGQLKANWDKCKRNDWIGLRRGPGQHEGYESIAWDAEHQQLLSLVESSPDPRKRRMFRGKVIHLSRDGEQLAETWLDPPFDQENKGFEGLEWLPARGERPAALLALRETPNKVGGELRGHIHIFFRQATSRQSESTWRHHDELLLPAWLKMKDFADLAVREDGRIAVVSQESAMVWVGRLELDALQLIGAGVCYRMPVSKKKGKRLFAFVEGICWEGDNLLCVSDKPKPDAKKKEKRHAESIHRFRLPCPGD